MGDGYSSVIFTGINKGYIVGESGVIKRSSDGGSTWQNFCSGTTRTLFSVYFPDSLNGYTTGDSGTILKTINGGGMGINERLNKNNVEIYPNPATNKINISFHGNSVGETLIGIINSVGEQIIQEKFLNQTQIEMDVSNITKGIYLLKIQTKSEFEVKKLVIQ